MKTSTRSTMPTIPEPESMDSPRTLEDLFRKYSSTVYRVCLRYTRDAQDAEDMVSEVFMKVGRHMDQFRGESRPMVWIYRIAVNQCLDYLRSRKKRGMVGVETLDAHPFGMLEGHGDSCLTKIILERILEKINPTTRRILFMSHVEGMTHEEIAHVLNVSRHAVTKKLQRFSEQMKTLVIREAGEKKQFSFRPPAPAHPVLREPDTREMHLIAESF